MFSAISSKLGFMLIVEAQREPRLGFTRFHDLRLIVTSLENPCSHKHVVGKGRIFSLRSQNGLIIS